MQKPKVTIIRGPGLSKWEMQIYEPLTRWFDITGIGATDNLNDASGIAFPVRNLPLKWKLFQKFPKFKDVIFSVLGDTQYLSGFYEAVRNCDLLHTVELRNGYSLQAVRAKKRGLVKFVTATIYENIPFLGDEYPARKRLKEEVIAGVDHFLAANEAAKQALLVEGIAVSKISIIPQSVDTNLFTQNPSQRLVGLGPKKLRKKFDIQTADFVVLGVGRMVWEKGWYDIVRSAHLITNINPPAGGKKSKINKIKFLLVGKGPELKHLQQMVNRLALNEVVKFTDSVSYQMMPDFFRLADVFAQASLPTRHWNEQFGGVLIEAMATGLPIIGTLNGGIKETVGEAGGLFVPPQDYAKLAEAILGLFKNSLKKRRLGVQNRHEAINKYDTRVVAQKIKKIWDQVLR